MIPDVFLSKNSSVVEPALCADQHVTLIINPPLNSLQTLLHHHLAQPIGKLFDAIRLCDDLAAREIFWQYIGLIVAGAECEREANDLILDCPPLQGNFVSIALKWLRFAASTARARQRIV